MTPATFMMAPPILLPGAIVKRDGRVVPFESERIENAIGRCLDGLGRGDPALARDFARAVVNIVSARYTRPTVEQVQDVVETVLQAAGQYEAAKAYILYRAEHAVLREKRPIPEGVRAAFAESDAYFPAPIQQFQFYDKYSRFNYDLGRRETWVETVNRAVDYLHELAGERLPADQYADLRRQILNMRAMPSMRLLAMAGPAARRQNLAIFNCSALPVDSLDSFVEALIISMAGCGVGFSVERQFIDQLPPVRRQGGAVHTLRVADSSEGWAEALRTGLSAWFGGQDLKFDLSQVRPAGAPLVIKGGRASGPEPLRLMLERVRGKILSRQGSFLRPIDAHDIMCLVGNAAVSGGVRRTAMLSLFDYHDEEMRHAKDGDFEGLNSQRWNANNSAVWPAGLTQADVMGQMLGMFRSERGEPGIFNREGARLTRPSRRAEAEFLCNPCGEINLRPHGLCNLSIAVARAEDDYDSLRDKVRAATVIGTIQSLATHYPGLRDVWRINAEEERLLGVDINGQYDSPLSRSPGVQAELLNEVLATNREIAARLGIRAAAAATCVKPSGNSSQLLDCSSGIHPRWAPYYVRNVRVGAHTPVYQVLRAAGAPMDPENGQTAESATTWVVHFPVKAPQGAITRGDLTAIQQCDYWLQVKQSWTEHNPSVTITYQPDELLEVTAWVWEHRQVIGGLTFLPANDAAYQQMPYLEITAEEYQARAAAFPAIDFSKLYYYEQEDLTTAAQELACLAGSCETDLQPQAVLMSQGA